MEDLLLKGILDGALAFTGPKVVQFDITNKCNNNCLCCWRNSPLLGDADSDKVQENTNELPVDLIKKTIRELKQMGTEMLFFAGGGEPFIHPDIMEILEYAKENHMQIFINTNFTLIDEKKANELVKLKIDHIHVSLLAGRADTYALIHPNKSQETFHKIKDILRYVAVVKQREKQHLYNPLPHINLYYVVFNKNYNEIEDMVSLAIEVKADSVEFVPIDTIPNKTDILLLDQEQVDNVIKATQIQSLRLEKYNVNEPVKTYINNKDAFIKRINSPFANKGIYEFHTVTRQPCYVGWVFARIKANGEVNPCLKAHKICIGNIHNKSFAEIWNSQEEQLFRKKSFNLDFNDPYFNNIGNNLDLFSGCLKSCDNMQINIDVDKDLNEILKKHGRIK